MVAFGDHISDPRKNENKTTFDVKDEKGEYYVVIDETELKDYPKEKMVLTKNRTNSP